MRFRSVRAVAALALALGILGSSNSGAVRPEAVGDGSSLVTPVFTPLGVSNAPVTVVVQLAGDSVAEQQANAGRKLDRDEKERIKSQLKSQHDGMRGSIEGLGGTVVANYRAAYNGIKVRIAGDRVKELAALPGVVAVRPLQLMKPDNLRGIPLIGAPAVWQNLGLHGEGVKIAVIDTGIDYTHANFGGPGTAAAYAAAHAAETAPADPALFGPSAPRVKGGTDLVGDSYNADPNSPAFQPIPHPDPNPLDCNGHGSHVSGTAAGSGITSAGATYTGPYNASTLATPANFSVGPGVAPKADLYAVRVFGCQGSTDVVVDAIDWAVDNDMDVINMSLGSSFGTKDDPSAVASTNAARAGVVVVASAGNSGFSPYITGSPATADGAISVAANDPYPTFPGATVTFSGTTIPAIDANGFALSGSSTFNIKVIKDVAGSESLGCSVAAFGGPLPPNTIAVVNRGVCARVAKAIFGQQAGAAVVVMVNNAAGFPPFEGPITANPDDGAPFNVTIPFLGVKGPATTASSDGAKLRAAANGTATTVAAASITNPGFTGFASFTSGGPRTGDSGLKPDITAPGVSIISTAIGTGNQGEALSGTSMASPHVAGAAALTRQAHPTWRVGDIKAAIVNTGRPSGVAGYQTSLGGTGLVQPASSTATQVVARTEGQSFGASLNFGFAEFSDRFRRTKDISLRNHGSLDAIFTVAQAAASGSPHTVSLSRTSVRVPAHGQTEVSVTLDVPAATAGASDAFHEVVGLIEITPASASDNAGVALRVPYYLVPRALSDVSTSIGKLKGTNPSTIATVTNRRRGISGDADFYAWGIFDRRISSDDSESDGDGDNTGRPSNDVRAIGVQSFPTQAPSLDRQLLVFAVNTYNRWSNASTNEFAISVDVDGDGIDDYVIVGIDQGAVQLGAFNGVMGSFVFSKRSPGASIAFLALAPTDSSTALLSVRSSQLCRTGEPCLCNTVCPAGVPPNPRLTYHAESFDLANGGTKVVAGSAKYNAWSSSISQGGFVTVAPGATDATTVISVDSAESALTPALGVMVVTFDNKSGADEAQLIRVDVK
jgi:minor extracellular serine protease Vpr